MMQLTGPLLFVSVCGLAACVAYDPRVETEPVMIAVPDEFTAAFRNTPSYVSQKAGLTGHKDLSGYLDSNVKAELVVLAASSEGLTIRFERDGNAVLTKMYRYKEGLLKQDGKFVLPSVSRAGSGAGGVGYQNNTTTLFINNDGDLVAAQSGGGIGLLFVIPVGVHAQLMSIFPKTETTLPSNNTSERDASQATRPSM